MKLACAPVLLCTRKFCVVGLFCPDLDRKIQRAGGIQGRAAAEVATTSGSLLTVRVTAMVCGPLDAPPPIIEIVPLYVLYGKSRRVDRNRDGGRGSGLTAEGTVSQTELSLFVADAAPFARRLNRPLPRSRWQSPVLLPVALRRPDT